MKSNAPIKIGWGAADITPDKPALVSGQFHARISEGVMDPITTTALAIESGAGEQCAIMVSCDLVAIPDNLLEAVRAQIKQRLPEIDPLNVFLNATHTHAAPETRVEGGSKFGGGNVPSRMGVELDVMDPADYVDFAARRIAEAVATAWKSRTPGGLGFGLGQALVGRNRRISYYTGETKMYGKTDDPEFSHVEGYEDHAVNLLCAYDAGKNLTGMIVNLACPSQVSESSYQLSADFWHDARVELRRRFGENLFILPQNSASGDQSPHVLFNQAAEARMLYLKGLTDHMPEKLDSNLGAPLALRKEIALRIADTISAILPAVNREIDMAPVFRHRVETVELSRRDLTQADVDEALAEAGKLRASYEELRADLVAHPEKKQEPRWYVRITAAYRRMKWYEGVADRYELQKTQPRLPIEVHVLRLGEVALATNPFEYYVDFGVQIKARSAATQTFLVQHVGAGTYLPSDRAVAGKSYGAVPASTPIGAAGGRELVDWTLDAIKQLWAE